jgi:CHAD domain-containing protein
MRKGGTVSRAPLDRRLVRHLRKQGRRLVEALEGDRGPEAVHDARRAIKQLRSALRLLDGRLPGRELEPAASRLRELAHRLGPLRDHASQLAAFDRLAGRGGAQMRRRLEADPGGDADAAAFEAMATAARALRKRMHGWRPRLRPRRLWKRLARSYRRARRVHRLAMAEPDGEHLHEWRKRVKDLAYQSRLLRKDRLLPEAGRRALARWAERWGALADLLGELRDADLLAQRLGRAPPARARVQLRLARRCARREARLRRQALRIGARLHRRTARDHVRRLRDGRTRP